MKPLFVSCAKGLEYLLRDELIALGFADAKETRAGVHVNGDVAAGMRICLYSRLASRVLWPLAEFAAADDTAIYNGVRTIDWLTHLAPGHSFVAGVTLTGRTRANSHYLALRIKDAIMDQFRERELELPTIDKQQPHIRIHLHVEREQGQLSLDMAGTPLHQRGWRKHHGLAPLKENLAAAMLLRADWLQIYAEGGMLADPMCGSGTLLIEGALMAAGVPAGSQRDYFGFLGWQQCPQETWESMRDTAQAEAAEGLRQLRPVFFGGDNDAQMIRTTIHNAQQAGVSGFIHLARRDMAHFDVENKAPTGLIITNPPYGERMGERQHMPALYQELGHTLRERFAGWHAGVLAADKALGRATGLRSHKQYQLFNGALETALLLFDLSPDKQVVYQPTLSEQGQMLANRLRKNLRQHRKRLEREGIYCWRAYDKDLPEYAAAIDVYADRGTSPYLHIQEYRAPRQVPDELAQKRLHELVLVAQEVFEIPAAQIALKQRKRGKGGARYGKFDARNEWMQVEEGGLKFRVNLFDYLDTGLFLDHRPVREKIRKMAKGKRFLNLFAYTGSASVYAAAGGARQTVSVDLSTTYLEWASKNLELNGFIGTAHMLAQAGVFTYLAQDKSLYDLIFVDPPTFSNSKQARDFDLQKDHVRLLELCRKHLTDDGTIIFSNNFQRFKLDTDALEPQFHITDWTKPSIPFDFQRAGRIHQCYVLQKRKHFTRAAP